MTITFEQALLLLCKLHPNNCGESHNVFSWTIFVRHEARMRTRLLKGHYFTQDDVDELLELMGYEGYVGAPDYIDPIRDERWWSFHCWKLPTQSPLIQGWRIVDKRQANEMRLIAVVEYEAKQKGLL